MRVLIIEDERSASDFLTHLIKKYDESITIIGTLRTVASSVEWFGREQHPNLAFVDIQLADGLSFEIFERVQVQCPVIFTTAYQEYAIQAFRVNSIDYLLKPIDPAHLARAMEKYRANTNGHIAQPPSELTDRILKAMELITPQGKTRFVVKVGVHLRSVPTAGIICFCSLDKSTFLVEREGKQYDMDLSLDQLEEQVNRRGFFRINRNFLINRDFITDVIAYSGSRFKIKLKGYEHDDLLVSRKRASEFRVWLEQ